MNPYCKLEVLLPDFQAEINVLKNYCEAVDNLSDDAELVRAYTHDFRKLVEKAEIAVESKNLIDVSVRVGGNSAILWKEEINKFPEEVVEVKFKAN